MLKTDSLFVIVMHRWQKNQDVRKSSIFQGQSQCEFEEIFLEHIKHGKQKLKHACLTLTKVCSRVSSMFTILCAMTNVYM